jgi:AmmeMemoRadiSam system protein B
MPKIFFKYIIAIICLAVLGSFAIIQTVRHKPQITPDIKPVCCHNSYFSQEDFYRRAFDTAVLKTHHEDNDGIRGILVNHHLLASSFIAESFNQVATTAPLTVLLISPNHFDAGKANIITSAEAWKTPYGVLEPNVGLINQLATRDIISVEEDPFGQEHGITGIVAFVKKTLPNSKIVPVIFRNRMTLSQSITAADQLYTQLPENTLVVGSFDFSHYLTNRAADFHDVSNIAVLNNFDFSKIYNLDIDSRPGLAFFLELMKNYKAQNFHMLEHSNSAKLVREDILETTSYLTGYFSSGSSQSSSNTSETLLLLPPIENSPNVSAALNKNSKTWAMEYLERLFYGQDQTVIEMFKKSDSIEKLLNQYGISNILDPKQEASFLGRRIKISSNDPENQKDELEVAGGQVVFHFGNPLLSDKVLQSGGVSIAYGIALTDHRLVITLLPIGVKNGIAKLLIGDESDKVLADIAKNSNVSTDIKTQIKKGIITTNNLP